VTWCNQFYDASSMELDVYCTDPAPAGVPALSRAAERAGFAGIWFTESSHNPYLASALAATTTTSVTIGTDIAVAFPRSPMVTAQLAWDLAALTEGRFVLGLGTQVKAHMERRFSVPFARPAARIREYVLALRAIFAAFQGEAPLRFQGEFYAFSLLTDFFTPGPIDHPEVPIYLAAVNARLAAVAGEVADGVHAHPFHSARYLTEVVRPAVAQGATDRGRELGAVAVAVPVFVITGDTDEEVEKARTAVRRQLAFYGSTRTYQPVFDVHGWEDATPRLHAAMSRGDFDAMAAVITDDMLDAYAVTAPWDDVADVLVERYDGVADRVLPYDAARDLDAADRRERWAAVAAAFRSATRGRPPQPPMDSPPSTVTTDPVM
jgi:probable F420-dependent oxidoreductase